MITRLVIQEELKRRHSSHNNDVYDYYLLNGQYKYKGMIMRRVRSRFTLLLLMSWPSR